jgi:aminoglycoside phosphotransferase (APT) family kinase protein
MTEPESILRRRPPPEALRWVTDAIGARSRITSLRRMRAGTSSAVHGISVMTSTGRRLRLVLRRFVRADWLAREPDLASREARVLKLLRTSKLPTPELVAVDEDGSVCDAPAVLMTWLPGRLDLQPREMALWLERLAAPLITIHALGRTAANSVQPYRTYNAVEALEVPDWSVRRDAWRRIIELVQGPRPNANGGFIHRDYHPGNVLWSRGRLSGITDWVNASRGPAGIDVGHCRLNLATLFGVDVAGRFLDAYQALDGAAECDPYWDAITAIEFLPGDHELAAQWRDAGRSDLSSDLIRRRMDDYAAAIAVRI